MYKKVNKLILLLVITYLASFLSTCFVFADVIYPSDLTEDISNLSKNESVDLVLEISESSLYRVYIKGIFAENSIYNISVDGQSAENISVSQADYSFLTVYLELEKGQHKLTFNVALGEAQIHSLDATIVSRAEVNNFINEINCAKNSSDIKNIVENYENKLGLIVSDIEQNIFYTLPAYDRILGNEYDNINSVMNDLLSSFFLEYKSPRIKLSENNKQIFALKKGMLSYRIKRDGSDNTTFIAVYDDSNRLFYINSFSEKEIEDFCGNLDLRNVTNAERFSFRLITWNSVDKMTPKEKYDGVAKEIYMAPNGNDLNDGSALAPFATMKRVKEEIKKYNSNMQGDIVVNVASGTYFIEEEEVFSSEYSGTNGYKVVFKGDEITKPVFSGGRKIDGFKPWKNGIYKADFDSQNEMRELFVNGIPAVRAKSKWLYKYIEDYDDNNSSTKKIVVSDGEVSNISCPEDAELVWEMTWVCQRTPVENVEVINGKTIVTLANFYQPNMVSAVMVSANKNFYVENALELLDEPGEFYYSKTDRSVYYYPYSEENIDELEFVTPQTEGLFRIEGSSLEEKIQNISFENISIKHGTWFKTNDYPLFAVQAGNAYDSYRKQWDDLPTAQFNINYADNIEIKNCTFESMGTNALSLSEGVTNVKIVGNVLRDIGGAAISIGESSQNDTNMSDDRVVCKNIEISNNVMRRISFEYREMPAVVAYYGNGIKILNNDMKDMSYSGISAGWGWDSMSLVNSNNGRFLIKGNKISRVLRSVIDGAQIYTLGLMPDTVIKENYLSYNLAPSHLKFPGIYLDQGSKYIDVINNVVTNCSGRWLLITSSWDDINADISGNYSDIEGFSNKSGTALGENFTGLLEFPEEAQMIMEASGVEEKYSSLLKNTEIADERAEELYSSPQEIYFEGIIINATDYYDGKVSACGEDYVSFNAGNYMSYEIYIPKDGVYDLTAYIAVGGDDTSKEVKLAWQFNEVGVLSFPTAQYTGSYNDYKPFDLGEAILSKGKYTLWLKNNSGACHVQKILLNEREAVSIDAVEFYDGKVTACGEDYVSFNAGNYMSYEINIPKDGVYDLTAYIAVGGDDTSKKVKLAWQFNEVGVLSFPTAQYTGSYGDYKPFSFGETILSKGKYTLWIKNNSGGCHISKLILSERKGISIDATSFYDGKVTACGEDYVSFSVGNYMSYEVDIPKDGVYDLVAYIAVGGDDASKVVKLAWQFNEVGNLNFPNATYTGSYNDYKLFSLGKSTLSKGKYTLWLKNNSGACHVKEIILY